MSDSEEEKQEVELAEWVQIQKKTFTRWCNEQLKVKELAIDDLSVSNVFLNVSQVEDTGEDLLIFHRLD